MDVVLGEKNLVVITSQDAEIYVTEVRVDLLEKLTVTLIIQFCLLSSGRTSHISYSTYSGEYSLKVW